MGLNEKDKQHLDRWHRAEGTAKPPKRTGAPENNLNPMTHGIWANQCLNDEEREKPISLILSEEIGRPARFSAGGKPMKTQPASPAADDDNVEALARVFGREKIILRKDNP